MTVFVLFWCEEYDGHVGVFESLKSAIAFAQKQRVVDLVWLRPFEDMDSWTADIDDSSHYRIDQEEVRR